MKTTDNTESKGKYLSPEIEILEFMRESPILMNSNEPINDSGTDNPWPKFA